MNITFELLVTAAAVPIAAGIVTTLVALLKSAFPILDARFSGASMAFVLSAILYLFAAFALRTPGQSINPNDLLNVFLAWLAVASSSVGIKSTWDHVTTAKAKSLPVTDVILDPDGGAVPTDE